MPPLLIYRILFRKCDAAAGVRKDQRGDAIQNKQKKHGDQDHLPCFLRDTEPQIFQKSGKQADPDHARNSDSKGGGKTDVAPEIQQIAGIVPVSKVPEKVKYPSDDTFQRSSQKNRIQKYFYGTAFLF